MTVGAVGIDSTNTSLECVIPLSYTHNISEIEKIRAIALDFDGTLFDRNTGITPSDVEVFAKLSSRGFLRFLATGRSRSSVRMQLDDATLQRMDYTSLCPGVYLNGAIVYDKEENVIHQVTIERSQYLETLRIITELDLLRYTIVYTVNGGVCSSFDIFDKEYFISIEAEPLAEAGPEGLCALDCIKIAFLMPPELIEKVRPVLSEKLPPSLYSLRTWTALLEILPSGVNKATGIKKLLELYSLVPENLLAMGDEENDVEMLKLAAVPIAIGNAVPELKAHAKMVVCTNKQSGFSEAMCKLFGIT